MILKATFFINIFVQYYKRSIVYRLWHDFYLFLEKKALFFVKTRGIFFIAFVVIFLEIIIFSIDFFQKENPKETKSQETLSTISYKEIVVQKPVVKPLPLEQLEKRKKLQEIAQEKRKQKLEQERIKQEALRQKRVEEEKIKQEQIQKQQELEKIQQQEKEKQEQIKQEQIKQEQEKLAEQKRIEGIKNSYINRLRQELASHQKYPLISKAKREEGTTLIAFKIFRDGKIEDIHISQSSGYERLDKAALQIFTKFTQGYQFPQDIKEDVIEIVAPISFKIN